MNKFLLLGLIIGLLVLDGETLATPQLTINSPLNNTGTNDTTPTLNATMAENNPDTMWYSLDSGANATGCPYLCATKSFEVTLINNESLRNSWWNLSWNYRIPIDVTENSGNTLTDYQVKVRIDTTGKVNSDCSDIRVVNSTNDEIEYWVESGCGTTSTTIWVQVPSIPASGDETIYIYYGNTSYVTNKSDEFAVFNYSTMQPVKYVVSDESAAYNLSVISYRDGNSIYDGTTTLSLDQQENATFDATELSATTVISTLAPFSSGFKTLASTTIGESLTPISFAGTQFVHRADRGTQDLDFYAPFEDANVTIYKGDGSGLSLLTYFTVPNGTSYDYEYDFANDQDSVVIKSNVSILAHYSATTPGDVFPMYPAVRENHNDNTTDLWGVASQRWEIGILEAGTWVAVYNSSGDFTNYTSYTDAGDSIELNYGTSAGDGQGGAIHIVSNKPIGAYQEADGDGSEATVFLPERELDREYVFPVDMQYIAIATTQPSTQCTLYNSTGDVIDQKTSGSQPRPYPNKIYFGSSTDATNITAGARVVCDNPVYAYYEYYESGISGAGEETNVFGAKSNRKYQYPEPTTTSSAEEGIGLSEGTHNVTVYANDTSDNLNSTTVYFTIDMTYPQISYNPSTTSSGNQTQTWIFINASINETNIDTVYLNWQDSNESFDNNDGTNWWKNKTGLPDGAYTFYAWVNDTAGNSNQTSSRSVTIDATPPQITVNSPLNNSNINDTTPTLNVTEVESNPDTILYSVDEGANITGTTSGTTFEVTLARRGWWNSSWSYRQQINITNNNETEDLEAGYTLNITFDHSALVSLGKSLANGSDVRIVWYNSSSSNSKELDRINTTTFNSTSTVVWFKTQENISAGGSDSNYYVYYGNPSAGSPPADQNDVFMPGNDTNTILLYHFEDGSGSNMWDSGSGNYNGTGSGGSWATGFRGGGYRLDNGQSDYIDPGTFGDYPTSWTSTNEGTIEFWFYPTVDLATDYQLGGREGSGAWTINFYGSSNKLRFQKGVDGTAYIVTSTTSILADQWYHIAFTWGSRGQEIWINGVKEDTNSNTDEPKDDSIYQDFRFGQGGGWTCGSWCSAGGIFDGLRVSDIQRASFPYVFSPEPTTSLGGEEESGFTDGPHNVTVYANDTSGNLNLTTVYFTVDTPIPPTITFQSPLNQTYATGDIDFNITVDQPLTNAFVSIDGGPNNTMTNDSMTHYYNLSIPTLGDGGHNATLYANDSSGNMNSSIVYFTVDLTPYITLTSPTNTNYTTSTIWINGTINQTANVTFSLDGGTNQTACNICNSFSNTTTVSDGSHNITIYAVHYNNSSFTNLTTEYFTVDTTPPQITVTSPINQTYNQTNVWFNSTCSAEICDTVLVEYDNTNHTLTNSSGNWNHYNSSMPDATYQATFYANDSLGNINSSTVYFTVDTVPPYNITLNYPSNNSNVSTRNVNFNWTSYDATSNMSSNLTIDGAVNVSNIVTYNGTPTNYTLAMPGGPHNWSVITWDDAGFNITSGVYSFTVDATPPSITMPSLENITYNASALWFNATVVDAITDVNSVMVEYDGVNHTLTYTGGVWRRIWSHYNTSIPDGVYSARFWANDSAGNVNDTEIVYFTIDTTPTITINRPLKDTVDDDTFNVTFGWATVNWSAYSVNGEANVTMGSGLISFQTTLTGLSDDLHNITVYANGSGGVMNSSVRHWTRDTAQPYQIDLNYPTNNSVTSTSVTFNWTSYDATSNMSSNLTIDGVVTQSNIDTNSGTPTVWTVIGLAEGSHNWSITTWDNAGNSNTSVTYSFVVHVPPGVGGGGGGGILSVIGTGVSNVNSSMTAGIIKQFGYMDKQFYITSEELFGVLGAIDGFPIAIEQKGNVEFITYDPVETLGSDSYEMASEGALKKYSKASVVIIARGDLGVDSIAAVAYARALNAPILLVESGNIPEATESTLNALGTKFAIIVGGDMAVSKDVEGRLPNPTRIGGKDRFETAVEIAETLMPGTTIVITDGYNPEPNAVMIAAYYSAPIIYMDGDEVPEATKGFIERHKDKFTKVINVGISDEAEKAVEELV